MRTSEGGIALIRKEHEGRTCWLTQWNEGWSAFTFIGGHREGEESFRECVIREVAEELELEPGKSFTVAEEPTAHLEYQAYSHSAQAATAYTMVLYDVKVNDDVWEQILANPVNRWVSTDEIRALVCDNGANISETVSLLLTKADLW